MSAVQKTPHLGWLDAIRGGAALYVVCHHAVMQIVISGDHANDPLYRALQLITIYGHYAVDVFIVLSGYCLMLPVLAKKGFGSIWQFYLRRTIRIVLPYFAALILTLIFIYLWIGQQDNSNWAETSLPVSFDAIIKHILLIHQWFPETATKINPAFWSVGVEYQIYFIFPLFYWLSNKIGYITSLILITFTAYTLWGYCYYFNVLNPNATGTSIYYCALFFMGMTAAKFVQESNAETDEMRLIEQHAKALFVLTIVCILIVAMVGFLTQRFAPSIFFPLQIQSFFIGLLFSILLYLKGKFNYKLFKKGFIQTSFEWLGKIGFSVYLLHYPILAIVWKYMVMPMQLPFYWLQTIVELALGLLFIIIVARGFYHLIELPCHQLSKSIVNNNPSKKMMST